jgi:hypothetical protein
MRRLMTVLATTAIAGGTVLGASAADGASFHSATRPASEHVSAAVHHVVLDYQSTTITPTAGSGQGTAVSLHGKKAAHLVTLFNALKREPKATIHCDIAGGPETTVTFHGPHHTWVAKQAACTDVEVTRDGKDLPTLLPSAAWSKAVDADLGR